MNDPDDNNNQNRSVANNNQQQVFQNQLEISKTNNEVFKNKTAIAAHTWNANLFVGVKIR